MLPQKKRCASIFFKISPNRMFSVKIYRKLYLFYKAGENMSILTASKEAIAATINKSTLLERLNMEMSKR
jgi:hypothetical protein